MSEPLFDPKLMDKLLTSLAIGDLDKAYQEICFLRRQVEYLTEEVVRLTAGDTTDV
jgi:hypothetical protein